MDTAPTGCRSFFESSIATVDSATTIMAATRGRMSDEMDRVAGKRSLDSSDDHVPVEASCDLAEIACLDGEAVATCTNPTTADDPSSTGRRVKSKHQDPAVRATRSVIQQCCARNDLPTALRAYEGAVAAGTRIEPQSFYNLLSLCDGLADRRVHVGTPKPPSATEQETATDSAAEAPQPVDEEARQRHATRIKQHMDDLGLPLTETAYTALVKLCARNRQYQRAEELLTEAEAVQQCRPKLRMYSSLLLAYCDSGRMQEALQVWLRLSGLQLTVSEREYQALIQCATTYGYARVMQRVLLDLSEDVLVPGKETARAVEAWFQSPFAVHGSTTKDSSVIDSILGQIVVPYPDPFAISAGFPVQSPSGWTTCRRCQIEPTTGVLLEGCLARAALKPVSISDQCWQEMKAMNEEIVMSGKLEGDTTGVQGGRKGPKRGITNAEQRIKQWNAFKHYLERNCAEKKYDVIIDGANVGYFEQNFRSAPKHVDYRQIDWIVRHFLKAGKKVLLIIHSRHFALNLMPREFIPLERSWRELGVLYCTPPGMNDDWFWLHAALYCGPTAFVVTNDEMRDHHFQMLAQRSFLRWKDRQQIHFKFGGWYQDHTREVELKFPDNYSRRIQRVDDGLAIPQPKRGDVGRFLDGSHEASDDEPLEETYICIRPRQG